MCGIVGYIGKSDIKNILLDGLVELEYRGYDSAGIALIGNNEYICKKEVGKLKNLISSCEDIKTNKYTLGIGHTRWATHGKPTKVNAHPHHSSNVFVVHNGIIENYNQIKQILLSENIVYESDTDTEVIAHLFDFYYKQLKDDNEAFKKTISMLKGSYAILLTFKNNNNNKIFFSKNGSPLIIGKNKQNTEIFFASSENVLIGKANSAIYLKDNTIGYASQKQIKFFDSTPSWENVSNKKEISTKDGYRFFMEKEIYEQSEIIKTTMKDRIAKDDINFKELNDKFLQGITNIEFCACGTSYNACLSATYLFTRLAKIKTYANIASEFRYSKPILNKNTLFIVVSQSGETADTLEALKEVKKLNIKTLCVCNVDNSSISRLSDINILTKAGMEKGVASTKAFSSQSVVLWMLALYFAKKNEAIAKEELYKEIKTLKMVPDALRVKTPIHKKCVKLSKNYLDGHGVFFIGRDIFYPLALEGALKLKEISYLHAEGYPAGEMKHGPIALADDGLHTIALMSENLLYEKIKSNVAEISARNSNICVISSKIFDLADDFIKTPKYNHYMLDFFSQLVILQLLALEVAIKLNLDADMPRNLAKSVTVE